MGTLKSQGIHAAHGWAVTIRQDSRIGRQSRRQVIGRSRESKSCVQMLDFHAIHPCMALKRKTCKIAIL
jgi:hypothetical protein